MHQRGELLGMEDEFSSFLQGEDASVSEKSINVRRSYGVSLVPRVSSTLATMGVSYFPIS